LEKICLKKVIWFPLRFHAVKKSRNNSSWPFSYCFCLLGLYFTLLKAICLSSFLLKSFKCFDESIYWMTK
jgi:hypothetical protein